MNLSSQSWMVSFLMSAWSKFLMNADEESLAMIDDLKTNFRNRDPKREGYPTRAIICS